jgi:hypothetical protein
MCGVLVQYNFLILYPHLVGLLQRLCTISVSLFLTNTTVSKMSDPKPVYLVNSSRGLVVTQHARGSPSGAVMEHAGFKGNE